MVLDLFVVFAIIIYQKILLLINLWQDRQKLNNVKTTLQCPKIISSSVCALMHYIQQKSKIVVKQFYLEVLNLQNMEKDLFNSLESTPSLTPDQKTSILNKINQLHKNGKYE
jgi:hypothetical protein